VRRCKSLIDGQIYAIKSIPFNQKQGPGAGNGAGLQQEGEMSNKQMQEVEIMRGLKHPNIIEYRGCFTDSDFGEQTASELNIEDFDESAMGGTPTPKVMGKKKLERRWTGQCLHILLEFAECGDVQELIQQQLNRRVYFKEADLWAYAY
jgi:serine/threonine protein kinase